MTWIEPRVVVDDKNWQKPTLGEIYAFFERIEGGRIDGPWMVRELLRNKI
jgi:hypothetical protein